MLVHYSNVRIKVLKHFVPEMSCWPPDRGSRACIIHVLVAADKKVGFRTTLSDRPELHSIVKLER